MSLGARYLLISVSCFAIVNLTVKALPRIPFEQIVFARGFICVFLSYLYLKILKIHPWGNNRKMLMLRGAAGTIALSCFFYTLHTMPLATAVTIQYLNPIFTVLISFLFFKERVSIWHWLCSMFGFLGVGIIQGFDTRVDVFDVAVGVLGALASAVAYNTVRSLKDSDHEMVVIFYFPLMAMTLTLPFAIGKWVWPTPMEWLFLLIVGVMTQFAQLYLTRGYQAEKASSVAVISYLAVVYAIVFGVVLFGEGLPVSTLVGILVIVASVGLSRLIRPA